MNRFAKSFRRLFDLNPVTLKELRQLVRSRLILWAMFLFPIVLLAVNGLVIAGSLPKGLGALAKYEAMLISIGPNVLVATSIVLGLVTVSVLPLLMGFRLTLETRRERMDLQFVTALSATDVIGGKLMAAFLVGLTFTALALPFLTLAYLLRGLDLLTIAGAVLSSVTASVVSSAVALVLGSLRLPVGLRMTFLFGGYLGGGLWSLLVLCVVSAFSSHYGSSATWLTVDKALLGVGGLVALVAVLLFSRALAASNLMPEHTDFKSGLRRLEAVLVVLALALSLAFAWRAPAAEAHGAIAVTTAQVLMVIGALALFHPAEVPRAALACAPRSFLGRLLHLPFRSTAASGALFSLLGWLFALAVFYGGGVLSAMDTRECWRILRGLFACYGEVLFVATALALVFRALRASGRLRAAGPLVTLVFLLVLGILGTVLEGCDILNKASVLPGVLSGAFASGGSGRMHFYYGVVGMMVFLPYLAIDGLRVFRRYRRPAAQTK